jgi:hypothetical protein
MLRESHDKILNQGGKICIYNIKAQKRSNTIKIMHGNYLLSRSLASRIKIKLSVLKV